MQAVDLSKDNFQNLKGKTCAELVVEYLKIEGVEYVFGVSGGTIVPFIEAMDKDDKLKFIMCKHEGGASFMADMYARISGKLGVCLSTAGPGATNMLTGVACAQRDGVPLLAITGQPAVSTIAKGAVQESSEFGVNIVEMYGQFCPVSVMVYRASLLSQLIMLAFRSSLGDKKQASHLSFPADVSAQVVESCSLPLGTETYRVRHSAIDREPVKKAAKLLLSARRAAILVGEGANKPEAIASLLELAELLCLPVITTPKGKGSFPETHMLSLGVFGFAGCPWAKEYIFDERLDLLLIVGSDMCEFSTESWDPRILPSRYLIQIDADPGNIGRNFPVSLGIIGDPGTAMKVLINSIGELSKAEPQLAITAAGREELTRSILSSIKGLLSPYWREAAIPAEGKPMPPALVMRELNACLERDAIVIADAGNAYSWSLHYLQIVPPQRYVIPMGFASMGHGTAGAVGAKLAAPGRQVIAIVGDGSALMNGNEIHTAAEYGVSCVWLVLNDGAWGMVDHGIRALKGKSMSARFHKVDFAALAEVYGAKGFRVERPGDLGRVFGELGSIEGPVVIDALIDPNEEPPFMERIIGIMKYEKAGVKP